MASIKGGCLCGSVTYESTAEPMATMVCHCTSCQKQSGGAFSVNVVVPTESITATGTLKTYTDQADSGNTVDRQFCPDCGSPLFSRPSANPAITVVKAGTLDDTAWVTPGAQIWCDSRMAWVHLDDALQAFPRNFG